MEPSSYALITVALNNPNVDTKSKEEIVDLLCQLLNIIGVPSDSVEKLQLRYINTIINYYTLSEDLKIGVNKKMKEASLVAMDNRMCIMYKIGDPLPTTLGVDKTIHNDIVGFMCYYYNEKDQKSQIVVINHIFIKRGHRRQGLATRLINALQSSFYDTQISRSSFIHRMNNDSVTLPILFVKVPMYKDSLQLFFNCGFEIARVNKITISLDQLEVYQKEVKDLVESHNMESIFFIPNHESLMYHEIALDRHMKYSFQMLYIMECCYACKATTTSLSKCSKCKSVQYCSMECQKKDWKKGHKLVCSSARI